MIPMGQKVVQLDLDFGLELVQEVVVGNHHLGTSWRKVWDARPHLVGIMIQLLVVSVLRVFCLY